MNTIASPPEIKRISAGKRVFGVVLGLTGALGANVLLAYSVSSFYTRNTKFVPYDTSSPDLSTDVARKHNPAANPPVCIDHAVKTIPYAKLPEKYWVKGQGERVSVNQEQLTTDFCRGIWSGVAYRVQRRYLERKYRALPGREGQLWDVKQLEQSDYKVGTVITDHFEVLEHTPEKVCRAPCFRACLAPASVVACFCRVARFLDAWMCADEACRLLSAAATPL